jgi:hypothetical protein
MKKYNEGYTINAWIKQPTKLTATNKPTSLNVFKMSSTSARLPAIRLKIPSGETLYIKRKNTLLRKLHVNI